MMQKMEMWIRAERREEEGRRSRKERWRSWERSDVDQRADMRSEG
jgi:hypothetical protein